MAKKMDDASLLSLVEGEARVALGYEGGSLSKSRQKAMEYYFGKAVGDLAPPAIVGRSAVVDTSVMDTIEWMLPALMKVFVGADKIVEFRAKEEAYEEQEKNVTEYIGNHIFKVQNDGFAILHTWFKDAMLSKNGVVKVWWDASTDETREDYIGLTDVELALLLQDPELKPLQHTENTDPATGAVTHDVAVTRTKDTGYCRIDNIPPEEFLISRRCRRLKDSPFTAHRFERTIGELKESGYKNVDDIGSDVDGANMSPERIARQSLYDDMPYLNLSGEEGDASSRVVWVTESFLKVDYDGDGIPEWRKVTTAGGKLLENIEVDSHPFVSITPVLIPHQFTGMSIADLAMESQRDKTFLGRAIRDNIYMAINGRTWAVEGAVNIDDLLTNRPGSVVRVKRPDAVGALQSGMTDFGSALSVLDSIDQARENRTGWTRQSQGISAEALNQQTAQGMNILTNRADMRQELLARVFAQGVKELFLKVLEQVCKHQNKPDRIRATGKWVDVDPSEWKNQFHLEVVVGLGSSNKDQVVQGLTTLGAAMAQAAQAGVVKPENVYKAGVKMASALGFSNPEQFFTDPATQPPPPPPPPDTQLEIAKLSIQAQSAIEAGKLHVAQSKLLQDREDAQAKLQVELQKQTHELTFKQQALVADMEIKREEIAAKIGLALEQQNMKALASEKQT